MNRKKKINQIFKKRQKKKNSKLHTDNKEKYISKADREKLDIIIEENVSEKEIQEEEDQ
ncbi:DUF2986 domain-containing protein [Vibrio sp. F74]|uniref:DUF2986 domain-containing protein n=1 Tax=Vibrio sp. F74 TaxID=700020 RepID=UPI0035F544F8